MSEQPNDIFRTTTPTNEETNKTDENLVLTPNANIPNDVNDQMEIETKETNNDDEPIPFEPLNETPMNIEETNNNNLNENESNNENEMKMEEQNDIIETNEMKIENNNEDQKKDNEELKESKEIDEEKEMKKIEESKPKKSTESLTNEKEIENETNQNNLNENENEIQNEVQTPKEKYRNWMIVWAKQKGYPWTPAKVILHEKLAEKQKQKLQPILESSHRKEHQMLVRYLLDVKQMNDLNNSNINNVNQVDEMNNENNYQYQFGWVDEENIKSFSEHFLDVIDEKMICEKEIVSSIRKGIELSQQQYDKYVQLNQANQNDFESIKVDEKDVKYFEKKIKEKETEKEKMRNCNIGSMIFENKKPIENEYIQCFVMNQKQHESFDLYRLLQKMNDFAENGNGNQNEIIGELRMLNSIPIPLDEIINPQNDCNGILKKLMNCNNLVISTLAEMVLNRLKNEIKIALASGEYDRCNAYFGF